jgi:hypothetical protein
VLVWFLTRFGGVRVDVDIVEVMMEGLGNGGAVVLTSGAF